jgi:hypothetical protein
LRALKAIIEVKNPTKVYDNLGRLTPYSLKSFYEGHAILMNDLIESAGKLRSKSVGIIKGSEVKHMRPPSNMLKPLMNELFDYLKNEDDLVLIKSCVFHYEMDFIHAFIAFMRNYITTLVLLIIYMALSIIAMKPIDISKNILTCLIMIFVLGGALGISFLVWIEGDYKSKLYKALGISYPIVIGILVLGYLFTMVMI